MRPADGHGATRRARRAFATRLSSACVESVPPRTPTNAGVDRASADRRDRPAPRPRTATRSKRPRRVPRRPRGRPTQGAGPAGPAARRVPPRGPRDRGARAPPAWRSASMRVARARSATCRFRARDSAARSRSSAPRSSCSGTRATRAQARRSGGGDLQTSRRRAHLTAAPDARTSDGLDHQSSRSVNRYPTPHTFTIHRRPAAPASLRRADSHASRASVSSPSA